MAGVIDVQETLDVRGRSQLTPMDITTTVSEYNGFTDTSAIPVIGLYYVWSTVDCHFKHNTATGQAACTALTGVFLNNKNPISIKIHRNDVISALADTTTGKLKFILIRSEA